MNPAEEKSRDAAAGYVPLVKFVPYRRSDERSPEQLADHLCRRYFKESDRERLFGSALAAAKALAEDDGVIRDTATPRSRGSGGKHKKEEQRLRNSRCSQLDLYYSSGFHQRRAMWMTLSSCSTPFSA